MKTKIPKSHTISNFKHLMDTNKINFEPEYQRGFVWKKPQKELFIDSLLLGYDVPKIYFHDNPNNGYKYDVIDGQQRLKTINEFLTDKVSLPKESDPIAGELIAGKFYGELSEDLQMEFQNINLDVVILTSDYSRDDIEDMFLRYQNGEPLNAAEKRKAIPGKFRDVVKELSENRIFEKCSFTNHRDGYQDATAKILHLRIRDTFTSITPASIKATYLDNKTITNKHKNVLEVTRAFRFLLSAFNKSTIKDPKLKKFAILTLTELAVHLLDNYTITDFKSDFANAYHKFEQERVENAEIENEQDQDQTLNSYTDAARGDSPAQQKYRFDTLLNYILTEMPELETKDANRDFSQEQRLAIFHRDDGICQTCHKKVELADFHADHIIPHSKGGLTKISNGQLLCSDCNLRKGKKL